MIAQIEQGMEIVDKAAAQSDRWLFLAALVVLLFFVAVVIRWLVKHIEGKDQALSEERLEFRRLRTEDQGEYLKSLSTRDALVAALTDEVRHMGAELKDVKGILMDHHTSMTKAHAAEAEKLLDARVKEEVMRQLRGTSTHTGG